MISLYIHFIYDINAIAYARLDVLWTYEYFTHPYIDLSKLFYILFEINFAQYSQSTICLIQ